MLKDRLTNDLKDAMRAKDEVRLRTIRSLRAALQDREIAKRKDGEAILTEEEETAVLQKQAKQRRDAIDQYREANRQDLVAKEEEELAVIEEYLPEQLSDEELRRVIGEIIASSGAGGMKDMGRVMGPAMEKLRGRADGRRVSQVVREMLS